MTRPETTAYLSIGDLARATGLSLKALRHYHAEGILLPVEVDPASGYRRYGTQAVALGRWIAALRELELPIPDIRALLAAAARPAEQARILEGHRARLEARRARAEQSLEALARLVASPPRSAEGAPCTRHSCARRAV